MRNKIIMTLSTLAYPFVLLTVTLIIIIFLSISYICDRLHERD